VTHRWYVHIMVVSFTLNLVSYRELVFIILSILLLYRIGNGSHSKNKQSPQNQLVPCESTPNLILSVTLGSGLNTGQLAPLAFLIVISNFVDKISYRDAVGSISSYSGIVAAYLFCGPNVNSIWRSRGAKSTCTVDLSIFLAKTARTLVCWVW
jgi:hypothetical protein